MEFSCPVTKWKMETKTMLQTKCNAQKPCSSCSMMYIIMQLNNNSDSNIPPTNEQKQNDEIQKHAQIATLILVDPSQLSNRHSADHANDGQPSHA